MMMVQWTTCLVSSGIWKSADTIFSKSKDLKTHNLLINTDSEQ